MTTTLRPIFGTSPPRSRKIQGKGDSPMLNYIFDSYATSNKHFHDKFRPPSQGGNDVNRMREASRQGDGVLQIKINSCVFQGFPNVAELLTLDMETHSADTRYRVELSGDDWRLSLSDVKVQDSGLYCCQVSTHPPLIRRVNLTVHRSVLRERRNPISKMFSDSPASPGTVNQLCIGIEETPRCRWTKLGEEC
ncbi:hypothetical protein EVAR_93889_1 [Eumeta japonica]|uniref:Ig-like domain-containing protein n=1 Tax=Eumeta variegata TaxID=151549 RepID=A0A4C1TX73_EUMVA|nr:hypothetical protein EVAR_93889_1 [Eumeta japonica]